jgi:hypothetical protein
LVSKWEELKRNKVQDAVVARTLEISRATYYRYKKQIKDKIYKSKSPKHFKKSRFGDDIRRLVLKIRQENPTYGKNKIAPIMRRDYGVNISNSSVGRIIKALKLPKSASALRVKRTRKFSGHAQAYTFKKYSEMKIGERVQIDHMTVTKNNTTFKHFDLWDRRSKTVFSNVYSNAKSGTAKKFLDEFIENAPFKILSIQVDGGSEFMGEFENTCEKYGIPLIVLPPVRPQYNGGVERSNRTCREEFYSRKDLLEDSICGMRRELRKFVEKYNKYRPHEGLNGLTPAEYLAMSQEEKNELDEKLYRQERKRRERRLKRKIR